MEREKITIEREESENIIIHTLFAHRSMPE